MKHIKLIEGYDSLLISKMDNKKSITHEQAEELATYIEEQQLNDQYIIWGSNSILFLNYVGFIQCSDFSIELLPKVTVGGEDSCREVFYMMLNEVGYMDMKIASNALVSTAEDSLLEMFAAYFAQTLIEEFNRGIITRYIQVERNLPTLKGSMLVQQHIRENLSRNKPYQAYCEYEERTADHRLNQVFKKVTTQLLKVVARIETQSVLQQILHLLDDVSNKPISYDEANAIHLDRTSKRYEEPLEVAKLFLSREVSTLSHDDHVSFSILFEMNNLFEKYIAQLMSVAVDGVVHEQHAEHRLLINKRTNRGIFQLRPDLVIERYDAQIIVDTKWKRLKNMNRKGVQRDDLYQMYAYVSRYSKAKAAILLYPYTEELNNVPFPIEYWEIEGQPNKNIAVHMIPLHNRAKTVAELKKIVEFHM